MTTTTGLRISVVEQPTVHYCEGLLYVTDQAKGVYPKDRPLPKCMDFSRYIVNGKCYCRRHAALIVLDLVLANREV